jgi:hypothetical protein
MSLVKRGVSLAKTKKEKVEELSAALLKAIEAPVLPALVPGMTYEGMEVANGEDAGVAWESLIKEHLGEAQREKIRKSLLDYCGQDTLAMVRLMQQLRQNCD